MSIHGYSFHEPVMFCVWDNFLIFMILISHTHTHTKQSSESVDDWNCNAVRGANYSKVWLFVFYCYVFFGQPSFFFFSGNCIHKWYPIAFELFLIWTLSLGALLHRNGIKLQWANGAYGFQLFLSKLSNHFFSTII